MVVPLFKYSGLKVMSTTVGDDELVDECKADVIVSRAGAITISELCHVGKPAILIPSPNVAEDHQTSNAQALVQKNAALSISDKEAESKMMITALDLLKDEEKQAVISENIKSLAINDSCSRIVDEIISLMN